MKILYQWEPWAYSNIASIKARDLLWLSNKTDICWLSDFLSVRDNIDDWNIWVLPIENSKAWSIHENIYNFLSYDYKIIWEISLLINHCLLSLEKDISNIKEVYSHPQALSQCSNYLKNKNIKPIKFYDTAWAAKMIKENNKLWVAAIASNLAWEIYGLNIIDSDIQDSKWNTTRFFLVVKNWVNLDFVDKKWKIALIFEAKNIPSSLYKCLWAFATNNVNLTKIESMPSLKSPFSYMFYLELEWHIKDTNIIEAIKELEFFTTYYKILWEY